MTDCLLRRLSLRPHRRAAALLACATALGGCASFSPDGGISRVSALTAERTGQPVTAWRSAEAPGAAAMRTAELLQQPLAPDGAVEVALLNHRGLQASLAALGIAEADLVQAGRLRNPVLGFSRLALGGGAVEIERSVLFDLLGLLTMPAARQAQQQLFEQAQLHAAQQAVLLAADTRRAWFDAVAAHELVRYFGQVQQAAQASAELAQRMAKGGNFSPLEQLREQAFQADATAGLMRAQRDATQAQERLTPLLGTAAYRLPERLPDLPATPPPADASTAIEQRLDLLMATRATQAAAAGLDVTQATRWLASADLTLRNRSETGSARARGAGVDVELPLFDMGAGGSPRARRAEAAYLQAAHRQADLRVQALSEVRQAQAAWRQAYEVARHYRDEVVPLRKRISEQNLLRYNGMLISVFELLADAREQVRAISDYVQALREHWVATVDLQVAMTAGSGNVPAQP